MQSTEDMILKHYFTNMSLKTLVTRNRCFSCCCCFRPLKKHGMDFMEQFSIVKERSKFLEFSKMNGPYLISTGNLASKVVLGTRMLPIHQSVYPMTL